MKLPGNFGLIAPDELRSQSAKASLPGAFALATLGGTVHANLEMMKADSADKRKG